MESHKTARAAHRPHCRAASAIRQVEKDFKEEKKLQTNVTPVAGKKLGGVAFFLLL